VLVIYLLQQTTNLNKMSKVSKFNYPTQFELKKIIRDSEYINKLKEKISPSSSEEIEWIEQRQANSLKRKAEIEQQLNDKKQSIKELESTIKYLQRKLSNANRWIEKSDRDITKDKKCLAFQEKVKKLITETLENHIPMINQQISKANYVGAINFHEKYIRNKPSQVLQRKMNDCNETIKKTENYLLEFCTIKGKEKHLERLKKKLNNPKFTKFANEKQQITNRITQIESAIAFRKNVDKNPNNIIQDKLIEEYMTNETEELNQICNDEFDSYIDRIYFKGGFDIFYI